MFGYACLLLTQHSYECMQHGVIFKNDTVLGPAVSFVTQHTYHPNLMSFKVSEATAHSCWLQLLLPPLLPPLGPPVGALACLGIFWVIAAVVMRRKMSTRWPQHFNRWLKQHVVMSVVILLSFLYTTTTREIISVFSCQQVRHTERHAECGRGDLLERNLMRALGWVEEGNTCHAAFPAHRWQAMI